MGGSHSFDEAWRRQALRGDEAALRLLTAEMLPALYRFCLYHVGRNQHLCEEVVQETLLRALRELARYEPGRAESNIFPWLTGLARNEVQRVLGREKTLPLQGLWERLDRELGEAFAKIDAAPLSDEVLEREETRELVNTTMAQLPPHYRQALEAKYVTGQSVRAIAERWRMTEKATESLLSRARQAFRAAFAALCRNLDIEMHGERGVLAP
jgi:RNA polymerase sigma-70 factor (ECF subfamily)